MLKIRLKRMGAKKNPSYRIIVINSTTKREGRPVQELGYYNPKTKVMQLDKTSALDWVKKGAQPTETVAYLIKNCNDDGTLNYKKKKPLSFLKRLKLRLRQKPKQKLKLKKKPKPLRLLKLRLKKPLKLNRFDKFLTIKRTWIE